MPDTPFFPLWRNQLAPWGSRTLQTYRQVRAYTLAQLELCFASWFPAELFPKAPKKANSRDRHYTRARTFWCCLWQNLNPGTSGREVVRQLQALFRLQNGPEISEEDGAYCRARARLPLGPFAQALHATAQVADQRATPLTLLRARPLKVVDGSTLTLLADTPKNRAAYPAIQCQPGQPSFPMMRFVVLLSLASGAIAALAEGSLRISELSLLAMLTQRLDRGDILIGDRGFGGYSLIALLQSTVGVDFIGRTRRRLQARKLRRLAPTDWLVQWPKGGNPSPWLTSAQWRGLPGSLTLRLVQGSLYQKGYRVRVVRVVTTLLDPELYPAQEILQAYRRRWRLEMCLDDLKTTLGLESLRNRTPEMVRQELHARLIAHNLVRGLMAQAATEYSVPLERISFTGSLDALRQFAQAMAQARSKAQRRALWTELLRTLATDLVPERPGRREPRAVKRKKNRYPRLRGPRHRFRDHLKRHDRRRLSRLRKLGLKLK